MHHVINQYHHFNYYYYYYFGYSSTVNFLNINLLSILKLKVKCANPLSWLHSRLEEKM